ncbi:MAG: patatin-like phospholipase family protein [Candidatus Omnitrophota bacterium]
MKKRARPRSILFAMIALVFLAFPGCVTLRHPVPQALVEKATIDGMDEIRIIAGEKNTELQKNLLQSIEQESAGYWKKAYPILAISGGGANGAYGAGFLNGWSKEGSRPIFKIVTGVSTGAIIAPFAFLGSDYDDKLKALFTTLSTKDVMVSRVPFGPIFGNSLANNRPLAKRLAVIYDDGLLTKIADQHKRGRRLFVGTVNLDAQRFVVWDLGAIAVRGDINLFRKVILASSSTPITFSPVFFRVKTDGKVYDEMHVDGGTLTQVFTTYYLLENMDTAVRLAGIDPTTIRSKLYLLQNAYLSPNYVKVRGGFSSIASRAVDTIVGAQGVGDIYRIYYYTNQSGGDFNLAFIPADFKLEGKEMFDRKEMKRLFERGYADAAGGYQWQKTPPQPVLRQKDVSSISQPRNRD